jgi:glycine oxidase
VAGLTEPRIQHAKAKDDVIIVGGGVIGCSVAYYLAQAGARVTIFERGEIGGEASGAAAGMLVPLDDSL